MFTALQRRGLESKLLSFPDEGHWISKPQNSELYYTTVIGWLDKFLKRETISGQGSKLSPKPADY
jgi:dipeptidyl aminopeptidase/acylaminoacyl peptidase